MIASNKRSTDEYQVTFSPTEKQVCEIEKWLIAERKKTGEGFYCNWSIIKSSFEKNEMVTISINSKTIGFSTWQLTTVKTASIEITEIKPSHRKKGIGKKLTDQLLSFFKDKGVYVVELQCSPLSSATFWKSLGFKEFADKPNNYNFYDEKKLYSILTESLQTSSVMHSDETIELWNNEPYATDENTPASYIWNIEFIEGTRNLSKPIIHPAHPDWRLRWTSKGKTIIDDKIKCFNNEIDFRSFIIISQLIS